MVQTLYFTVAPVEALTKREWSLVDTILMFLSAQLNARLNGKAMVIEKMEDESPELFSKKLFFHEPITLEASEEFKEILLGQINFAFNNSGLSSPQVTFQENLKFKKV